MENCFVNSSKPDYSKFRDKWSYEDLKEYFDGITGVPFKMAACTFLSNVEGLGDYMDLHPFFEFQGYLAIAVAGLNENVMFKPGSEEFEYLVATVETFLSGNFDNWTVTKKECTAIKKDCSAVLKIYSKEKRE